MGVVGSSRDSEYERKHLYYTANRGRLLEYRKAYYKANSKEWRKRYLARREEILEGRKLRRPELAAYLRTWSRRNPERVKRYVEKERVKFRALKAEFISAYGGECSCCGESEPRFLTLEHVNGDGSLHKKLVAKNTYALYRDLKKRSWPKDGYSILCFNCNLATSHGEECPHRLGSGVSAGLNTRRKYA